MSSDSHTSDTLAEPKPKSRPAPRSRVSRPRLRTWIIGLTVLVTGSGLYAGVWILGYVAGEEFSPKTFRSRTFSFYEIPLIHRQITPIRRKVRSADLPRYLRQTNLIEPTTAGSNQSVPSADEDTWHLVYVSRSLGSETRADAQLLLQQLSLQHQNGSYWKTWSKDHSEKAMVLWPIVQRLARRELYVIVPGLLETAQLDASLEVWNQRIQDYLARQYRGLISDARQAGRETLADELMQEALTDDPSFDPSP